MQTQTTRKQQSKQGMNSLEAGAASSRMVSESGVGAHFDEQTSLEALAYQYSHGEKPRQEHWDRAREEISRRWLQATPSGRATKSVSKPSAADLRVEEAMHLDR